MRQFRDFPQRIGSGAAGWAETDSRPRDLALLAHDIRGALSGVIGGISLLNRRPMEAEARAQFDRVAAAAEGLASLVTDALGESTASGARPVALDELLRFLARRWNGEAGEKGLTFAVTAGDDLPAAVRVDFSELSRVLGNLIGNAIRHSEAGLVHLQVRRDPAGGLLFVLHDDGPGLGDDPGQGLGLHIARTLTERMGGRITLGNRPEGGLEAELHLPARLCEGRALGEVRIEALPDLGGLSVLLAEDNPTNQVVASQMLRSMGAEVVLADDGHEALDRFEAQGFDLVMVDIDMPRKSGLEVIRAVRARPDARARTPIIALTAYAMREHRDRIAEAGADGLIAKPIVSVEAFGCAVAQFGKPRPAEPAPAPEEEPLIDMAVYRGLAQAIGVEMMGELLDRVTADLTSAGDDLRRAEAPLDLATVRSASHILISVAGAVGALRLQSAARALNTAAHSPSGDAVAEGIRACLAGIDAALRFANEQRAQC